MKCEGCGLGYVVWVMRDVEHLITPHPLLFTFYCPTQNKYKLTNSTININRNK